MITNETTTMKKTLLFMSMLLSTIESFAIDPSGSRIYNGECAMDIPTPLFILGLIVATIGCLLTRNIKDKNGKRYSPGMLLLGILGFIGITFAILEDIKW